MKQIILVVLAILLLGAAVLGFVAYKIVWPQVETTQVVQAKMRNLYYLLFDQSVSPESNDQAEWRKISEQIVDSLDGGDGIVILGIHDQSQNASPMFQGEMKVLPDDVTYEEEEGIRANWVEVRKHAKEAIAIALDPPKRAEWTDIFGALNRAHADKNRETHILIFSDMKESTPALDLERARLTEENLVPSLNAAAGKYDWQKDQLQGAKVYCLLDSIKLGSGKPSPNDRTVLHQFWATFFRSFKAELITFETHLSPNQLGGASHVDN